MNHRLDELFVRAGGQFGHYGEPILPDIAKFAEKIVHECLEQVWYTREDSINGNVSEVIKDRIKQHFGVEE